MARILIWAVTNCASMGSFEDFLVGIGKSLREAGHEAYIATGDGASDRVRSAFADAGLVHQPMPIPRMQEPRALASMAHRLNVDLVHTHFLSATAQSLHILQSEHPCALVLTDHASTTFEEAAHLFRNRALAPLRRVRMPKISHVIGVSDFVCRRAQEWFWLGKNRVTRIHNGIDLARFTPPPSTAARLTLRKNAPGLDENSQLIGYVGQIIPEKGIDTLIDIGKRMTSTPNRNMVIIGDGVQAQDVAEVADTHPQITYLGRRDDVPDLLPFFDVLVVPSVWPEAFGLVAAEALAVGVPVVARNIGGLPEVIGTDGTCGALVDNHNTASYCEALERVLTPQNLPNLRKGARARAEMLFAIQDRISDTVSVYEQALSNH